MYKLPALIFLFLHILALQRNVLVFPFTSEGASALRMECTSVAYDFVAP